MSTEHVSKLIASVKPIELKNSYSTGTAFGDYAARLGKRKEMTALKDHFVTAGLTKMQAWCQAASRYGWFETWTEDKAKDQLSHDIETGRLQDTAFAKLPMEKWEDYVQKTATYMLPNPLPYIPKSEYKVGAADKVLVDQAADEVNVTEMNFEKDLTWAYENMGLEEPTARMRAPSAAALKLWRQFISDDKAFMETFTKIFMARKRREKDEEERRKQRDDDKRQQLSLLDRLAADFAEV